jgi:4-amino-4-deoxy-L-arabinose transferase-like glycosyltransferase
MISVSLFSIYLIGRRLLGLRRATLVVFAMMLYPLFIGARADRFNNYQVLLAALPLMIWLFLRAYEKPTAKAGVLLGLAAAVTIYSAVFGAGRRGACRRAASGPARVLRKPGALCRDGGFSL